MPVSRKEIINALRAERDAAQRTIERCDLALSAFEGVAETNVAVADSGPDMGGDRDVDTAEKPKKIGGVSSDNINRAKARVKRFEKPFTAEELHAEMGGHLTVTRRAIQQLVADEWLEEAGRLPRKKGQMGVSKMTYRYIPAGKDPTSKPRGEPHPASGNSNSGGGGPIAGTGQAMRSADHDINAIIRKLRSDGWLVTKTGSDHYRATKGMKQVRFSGSPPGQRAINAIKSNLRNAGANL